MKAIDRLGWVAGISFVSYGRRVGIRVSAASALSALDACLPPLRRRTSSPVVERLYSFVVGGDASGSVRRFHIVHADANRLARTLDLRVACDSLENDLRLYLAEQSRGRVFLHAGVVGWRGRALVIAGRSMSGKSSLVAALVRAGATYYSDEYAVLDAHGRVHPYSAPLSIRGEPGTNPVRVSAEELGGRSGIAPLPVGLFAIPEYREGARWRPRTLSTGRGMLALLANTFPIRSRPAQALKAIETAVSRAPVLHGRRGEAEETVEPLLSALESLPPITIRSRRAKEVR